MKIKLEKEKGFDIYVHYTTHPLTTLQLKFQESIAESSYPNQRYALLFFLDTPSLTK